MLCVAAQRRLFQKVGEVRRVAGIAYLPHSQSSSFALHAMDVRRSVGIVDIQKVLYFDHTRRAFRDTGGGADLIRR